MSANNFSPWVIKNKTIPYPIVCGGMGIGITRRYLAIEVAKEGGFANLSSAGLDKIISHEKGKKVNIYEAVREECEVSKSYGGYVGINIMEAIARDYVDSVRAALDAKVDAISVGAGLPLNLPAIQKPGDTALIPIVSSARALELICKKWERLGYRPDAAVLEGPLAGGHLGFKYNEINSTDFTLEKLFPSVKDVAMRYGNFPVIVAGGLYYYKDLLWWLEQGASAGQFGTRFLATHESSATASFKEAVIDCKKEDIIVVDPEHNPPGSPCGLPFRIIKQSPMFHNSKFRTPHCSEGYVLQKDSTGHYSKCLARNDCEKAFCICCTLFSSAGYMDEPATWTVGANGGRVNKLLHVKDLMDRLKGITPDD